MEPRRIECPNKTNAAVGAVLRAQRLPGGRVPMQHNFFGNIGSGQHAPTQFKASLGQTLGDVVHSHVKNGRNVFQENKGWLEIVD